MLLKDLILKAVTVISKYNKEISADIYEMTGRGATLLSGKGAYQKSDTEVLYAVVSQNQVGAIKRLLINMMKMPFSDS